MDHEARVAAGLEFDDEFGDLAAIADERVDSTAVAHYRELLRNRPPRQPSWEQVMLARQAVIGEEDQSAPGWDDLP